MKIIIRKDEDGIITIRRGFKKTMFQGYTVAEAIEKFLSEFNKEDKA